MTLDALTAARIGADAVYYEVSKRQMVAGEGVYLIDEDGRSYIDCASATFNLSLGYGHPAVIAAMRAQADRLVHVTSGFQTEVINELCAMLVELAPAGMARAHLKVASGSGANEGAIKMAQRATGARDVITLFRSHHGQSALTASISGNAFRREALVDSYPNLIVPDPYCRRCFYGKSSPDGCGFVCVDRIDQFIEFASRGDVAAIMVEPISGNGGNIVPPPGYFATLQEFCAARGIKIIMDEIQTGIGRTGYMFASEYFGITPDAITVAKGLGGSGAQVAGIITTEEMAGLPINEHSFTYGSNLMAAAAGVATLRTVSRPEFLENVRLTGDYILDRLRSTLGPHRNVFDVRGVGLMIGVEVVDDEGNPNAALVNHLAARATEHGLIVRTSRYGRGNVLKIRPPLILTLDEADLVCSRFEALFAEEL
ncbi:aspartate aminotransferase family protein [Cellulosimicrobium cellulans]|uniref:aspartate aminotransferase family protein n=1 Tax=Cellulosimicrobium cellulans TaxID=1710 RepID=UPI00380A2611